MSRESKSEEFRFTPQGGINERLDIVSVQDEEVSSAQANYPLQQGLVQRLEGKAPLVKYATRILGIHQFFTPLGYGAYLQQSDTQISHSGWDIDYSPINLTPPSTVPVDDLGLTVPGIPNLPLINVPGENTVSGITGGSGRVRRKEVNISYWTIDSYRATTPFKFKTLASKPLSESAIPEISYDSAISKIQYPTLAEYSSTVANGFQSVVYSISVGVSEVDYSSGWFQNDVIGTIQSLTPLNFRDNVVSGATGDCIEGDKIELEIHIDHTDPSDNANDGTAGTIRTTIFQEVDIDKTSISGEEIFAWAGSPAIQIYPTTPVTTLSNCANKSSVNDNTVACPAGTTARRRRVRGSMSVTCTRIRRSRIEWT